MRRGCAPIGEPPARSRAGVAVGVAAVVAILVTGCGWGIAEPVSEQVVEEPHADTSTTAPVLRYVAAPTAGPAAPLPDPRCRAARRLFLRAAVASGSKPFVVDADTQRLLDQVEVLATGEARDDIAATRAFMDRFLADPASLSRDDLAASVDRMDRLLMWTVTVCPPPQRPVWGCSTQIDHPQGNAFQGPYFLAVGQLAPDEAVLETLGEVTGRRVELTRSQNRVVYGWIDVFGLVRRRAEVRRLIDLWFVSDASRCDDPVNRPHPLDSGEVIVEELPDVGDGPQYATTTTTAPASTPSTPEELALTTTVPLQPCRYDPDDTSDEYETLGDYMANGPADTGCWSLLTPAGRDCLDDPPSGEFFACFDV